MTDRKGAEARKVSQIMLVAVEGGGAPPELVCEAPLEGLLPEMPPEPGPAHTPRKPREPKEEIERSSYDSWGKFFGYWLRFKEISHPSARRSDHEPLTHTEVHRMSIHLFRAYKAFMREGNFQRAVHLASAFIPHIPNSDGTERLPASASFHLQKAVIAWFIQRREDFDPDAASAFECQMYQEYIDTHPSVQWFLAREAGNHEEADAIMAKYECLRSGQLWVILEDLSTLNLIELDRFVLPS